MTPKQIKIWRDLVGKAKSWDEYINLPYEVKVIIDKCFIDYEGITDFKFYSILNSLPNDAISLFSSVDIQFRWACEEN